MLSSSMDAEIKLQKQYDKETQGRQDTFTSFIIKKNE